MFAGCGSQMIAFNALTKGKAKIVGVEINPLVTKFAKESPELKRYKLAKFYNRSNIEMNITEGRSFLDNDPRTYDVIYLGSSAATFKYKTGHSRKYLDTTQAMAAYFDHLRPDGLLVSRCSPAINKINSFKKIFKDQGIDNFNHHIMVAGASLNKCTHFILSKKPFTKKEQKKLEKFYKEKFKIQYLYGFEENRPDAITLVEEPLSENSFMVTDDRPFMWVLDFKRYRWFPSLKRLSGIKYYRSWTKITALAVTAILLGAIILFLYIKKTDMPPPKLMVYLVVTGFCYMIVEITFIGRLELFLENPLYSMALLLSVFLLSNAAGSILYNKYDKKLNMVFIPAVAGAITLLSMFAINAVVENRLGLPLPLKIIITIIITAPAGICLGLFYPYVVSWLNKKGRAKAIPITYGISTLSSVAGATYAMTLTVNLGYSNMFHQAAMGYALLTLFLVIYNQIEGK